MMQYQNQKIDVNTKCVLSSIILSLMLCWCSNHRNQNTTKICLVLPLYQHTHSPPPPTSLPLGHQKRILHFYDFVISRMWYEWNHSVYDISRLFFFFIQNIAFEVHLSTMDYNSNVSFEGDSTHNVDHG